ncbi:FAD-dependent oxidoreductase [Microbacter margulisiae]|uniref:NAD(P)H-flavin reductase n=1 Tax=Microbacter margulisiae TaxID=1350067 RepID=A0A7W5DQM6_9PORP|nr:FAD-dependent oxidoreductase [Microbacter margulisiae]MBB3187211.1 NAD(P)H-flavin reductase [Microbacter margulisiae]
MLSKKYKSQVKSIINPFSGIYTLEFESLDRLYKYSPGQFLHLAIDEAYDGTGQWPESRCFSMQSNPDEATIKITYAVKGRFTQLMESTLKEGSFVWLKLPYGELFTQPHNKTNTVFIAGGTGITPFLSLFTHQSFNEYINPKIYLGFRLKAFNIYEGELARSCNSSQFVKSYYEDKDGVLNIQSIADENSLESNYFVSGPPPMIKAFKQTLISKGVSAGNVLTDDWE